MANQQLVSENRLVKDSLTVKLIDILTKWEVLIGIMFIIMFIIFSNASPYFLDSFNLMNATFQFMEKSMMAMPMIFIIMCGDIDISVASIIALSAYGVGIAAQNGASSPELILIALVIGTLCGLFNGLMVTGFNMPSIAVTLATQSIFRGIAKGILTEHACTTFPENFAFFGQGFIGESIVPFSLILYIVIAIIFAFILHKTVYGRKLYAIGNSMEAARFSGVHVKKARVINFTLMGLICGVSAILLSSRILSVRSNIANGWDMEAITLVVLGGVAITGGKGKVIGVVI
ncbi:ABC transporter permease, partial [Clostridium sp.]|uniref:ABC transporter permease n=1 Tax=Clostridium sp. TaxID=1506 RepID=UPI001A3CE39E